MADLLARHLAAMQQDDAARREALAHAAFDVFGTTIVPGSGSRAGDLVTYADAVRAHLAHLSGAPDDYARVVHRAYHAVVERDAYARELDYWKQRPTLPFIYLAASIHDWARRNQPGLMVTAGVPSAGEHNPYLTSVRLSPAVAAEARRAAGLDRSGPPVLARHIVAPGAASMVSVGGLHFAAVGAPGLRVTATGSAALAPPATTGGWRLVWQDEFNGTLDPDWVFDIGRGTNGWGNNELQYYTRRPENVRVENGVLVIEARQETYEGAAYTSARLKTEGRRAFGYGRFEARIQVPRGQGLWPAFWALGADRGAVGWPTCGEIDVMEHIGREPAAVHGTVHGPGYSGAKGVGGAFTLPKGTFSDGFHVFAADWEPGRLTFSVDGQDYKTITPAEVSGRWVFDHPFFLLLNLAVGGNWPGPPDDKTLFPARMLVDYVRVYERATPTPSRK